MEIFGKNRRKVPVILTEDVKAAILALNKTRDNGEVAKNNEFVFALNNGKSRNSLRGHDVLKNTCNKVNLQQPDLVKFTNQAEKVCRHCKPVCGHERERDGVVGKPSWARHSHPQRILQTASNHS